MKKNRYVIVLVSVWIGMLVSVSADAQENLAQHAYTLIEHHCSNCHGESGSFKETLLIDHAALTAPGGAIIPGDPEGSTFYQRLITEDDALRMPWGQPPLPEQEIAIIERWIAEGAAPWDTDPGPDGTPFISQETMLTAIEDHLETLDPFIHRFARYFTMTHLYNAGVGPDELGLYGNALSKLVNSLSWGSDIVNPQPIDEAGTIFYIDLRAYEWDIRNAWPQMEGAYPYALEFDATTQAGLLEKLTHLQTEMDCQVPFVYVDWFLATASLPPLYHDILALPGTEQELERELRIDVDGNIEDAPGVRVWRAGTNKSGVSQHNRVVERHKFQYGAYWKSHDFAGSAGAQNIFTHPLSFQRDGGEVIFNLPNGLQAYYISDGPGNRIDVAPTDIVFVDGASDPAVRNGLSCIGCHTDGMKTFEDEVRATIETTEAPDFNKVHALRLYVEQSVMDDLVKEDMERYQEALALTVLAPPEGAFENIEPVHRSYEAFQEPLDAAHAAAAVGLETDVFLGEIDEKSSLQNLGLASLLTGSTVKRDVWTDNFSGIILTLQTEDTLRPTTDGGTSTQPTSTGGVYIRDTNLHAAIAETLGKPAGAAITSTDMTRLRTLVADDRGIRDLTGLEHATNLERIELRRNEIADLTPLAGLTKLNNIKLRGNRITNVLPLSNLTQQINWMGLEENAIEDLSPLATLVRLIEIGISGNPVSDVSPLASLSRLEGIAAWRTPISDFSALEKLRRLRWIEVGNDKSISAIPSLKGLKALRRLVIHGCNISDLSPLAELTQLDWLELVNNSISDVSELAKLTRLKTLNLDANFIEDVSPLAELSRLEVLYLENNTISDVSDLAELKNLERLDLRNNKISDFSPLDALPDETFVRMEGNVGFPAGGTKITGPWLWAIVPGTRLDDKTDFLSRATGGAATEIKVATNGAKEGKTVGKGAWRLHSLSATSGNNINEMTDDLGWGTGEEIYDHIIYGSVILDSPEEQQTTMLVGSGDAVKVWLNGELVHKAFVNRGSNDYQDFFSVTLKQGQNVLLVALDNHGHGAFSGFFGFAPDAKYEVFNPPARFSFSTEATQFSVGDTFTVHLKTENMDKLAGWQTDIVFDPAVLKANSVAEGDYLKQNDGETFFQEGSIENGDGKITDIQALQLSKGASMSRHGTLLSIDFTVLKDGESRLGVENFLAGDRRGEKMKLHVPLPEMTIVVGVPPASPMWKTDVIPEVTALLANYPNPFNPETYIPYQLSETAAVILKIYTADGRFIRKLDLGVQAPGIYTNRSRAAYWDGKNAVGESVASGVYFYTFTAGDFTATRKMLIRK